MTEANIKNAVQTGRVVEYGVVLYTISIDGKLWLKTWDLEVILAQHARILERLLALKTTDGVAA